MYTFYALPLSTYCAKVRIVLRMKSVEFKELVPPGGSYTATEYQQIVPAGSIPAIRKADFVLHDSDAIVEYLEDKYSTPSMRPANIEQCAQLRAISRFHDTRLEASVRALFPMVKKGMMKVAESEIQLAADRLFDDIFRLSKIINPHPFLNGETISLADCAFPTTLWMAADLLESLGQKLHFPNVISDWLENLQRNPIIEDEVTKNRLAIANWIASFNTHH